jgi:hypothetical protein
MRARAAAVAIAITALFLIAATASPAAGQGSRFCTWGGTPAAPTGVITLNPGVTNTPSTGPIEFTATGRLAGDAGCNGKLTFTGYIDPVRNMWGKHAFPCPRGGASADQAR